MKVIAGLGNPGAEYANTPHSIGFEVVDAVAAACGAEWTSSKKFTSMVASGSLAGVRVTLVKPQTYMNLSGDAVAPILRYSNAAADKDLVVISDDIDLARGRMRIRKGGSAGGHNGLKSIIERTGTTDFTRLRIGVGRDGHNRTNVVGHVLGKFGASERAVMDEVVAQAVTAVTEMVKGNLDKAMNLFNGWEAPKAAAEHEQKEQTK